MRAGTASALTATHGISLVLGSAFRRLNNFDAPACLEDSCQTHASIAVASQRLRMALTLRVRRDKCAKTPDGVCRLSLQIDFDPLRRWPRVEAHHDSKLHDNESGPSPLAWRVRFAPRSPSFESLPRRDLWPTFTGPSHQTARISWVIRGDEHRVFVHGNKDANERHVAKPIRHSIAHGVTHREGVLIEIELERTFLLFHGGSPVDEQRATDATQHC